MRPARGFRLTQTQLIHSPNNIRVDAESTLRLRPRLPYNPIHGQHLKRIPARLRRQCWEGQEVVGILIVTMEELEAALKRLGMGPGFLMWILNCVMRFPGVENGGHSIHLSLMKFGCRNRWKPGIIFELLTASINIPEVGLTGAVTE